MSSEAKKTASFYMSVERKKYIDDIVNKISDKNKVDKGEALYIIVKAFNDTSQIKESISYTHVKPFECNFLNYEAETWFCLEPMGSSKKPIELGIDASTVVPKCKACFEAHSIAENERKKKLLERSNIIKLQDFYKEFLLLTKRGFNADCVMCRGNLLEKNSLIMSRDGEVIYCPQQNMAIVNIKDVCNEVINPANKSKGCEYLLTLEHHVNFKGSDVEERIKTILPKLDKLEDEKEE